ncbi:hypothetical protein AAVH_10873 [Aphelenchoides avenae]|nr:hypothetical protein AAVH_10873 [Aphelenchus avenae]
MTDTMAANLLNQASEQIGEPSDSALSAILEQLASASDGPTTDVARHDEGNDADTPPILAPVKIEDTESYSDEDAAMQPDAEQDSQVYPPTTFGKANVMGEVRLGYPSRLYPGVELKFSRTYSKASTGRSGYKCLKCEPIAKMLRHIGVKLQTCVVLNGEIVDRDPDTAGTNFGHLCQQPERVAELKAAAPNGELVAPPQSTQAPPTTAPRQRKFPQGFASAGFEISEHALSLYDVVDDNGSSPSVTPAVPKKKRRRFIEGAHTHTTGTSGTPVPVHNTPGEQSMTFGKAIPTEDPTVVRFRGVFDDVYTFKQHQERCQVKDGRTVVVKTYRCLACSEAAAKKGIQLDLPFVKTVDGVFVERDPDCPLGNAHLCTQ